MIEEYYVMSKHIIVGIEQSGNRETYYEMIYQTVQMVQNRINTEKWNEAASIYANMYLDLKQQFYTE